MRGLHRSIAASTFAVAPMPSAAGSPHRIIHQSWEAAQTFSQTASASAIGQSLENLHAALPGDVQQSVCFLLLIDSGTRRVRQKQDVCSQRRSQHAASVLQLRRVLERYSYLNGNDLMNDNTQEAGILLSHCQRVQSATLQEAVPFPTASHFHDLGFAAAQEAEDGSWTRPDGRIVVLEAYAEADTAFARLAATSQHPIIGWTTDADWYFLAMAAECPFFLRSSFPRAGPTTSCTTSAVNSVVLDGLLSTSSILEKHQMRAFVGCDYSRGIPQVGYYTCIKHGLHKQVSLLCFHYNTESHAMLFRTISAS